MRLLSALLRGITFLAVVWALLVWGLPEFLRVTPQWCKRAKIESGICSESIRGTLRRVDAWSERTLRPLTKGTRAERTLVVARATLKNVEAAARASAGDIPVNVVLGSIEDSIKAVEEQLRREGTKQKLQDIPENAKRMLADARASLERLKNILGSTGRRAEEVSDAVNSMKDTLDQLQNLLPKVQKP